VRWFQPSRPSPDLGDVLTCRWNAVSEGRHELIPDGCIELLWIDGGGAWLCGPDTHGWDFELAPGTEATGVRFRPGAGATVLRLNAHEVRDVRVALADVLGSRVARILADRLAGVESLAEATGMSSRHLRRRFDRDVGYGPAFYARIARLQRFARAAARWPGRGLAELAAVAGYVDQPHLAKDCRSLARMTPRELVRALPQTSVAVRSVQDVETAARGRSAA